jgi:CheY-like chemotaxis protein
VNEALLKPVREAQLIRALQAVFSGGPVSEPAAQRILTGGRATFADSVRILVAEDNPVNQRVVSLMLKKLGYSPEVVANGAEALHALELGAYHAILMDCQMPEMDGFEATKAIRSQSGDSSRTPIIALTANALPGEREKCMAAGMNDYLAKPLTLELLSEKLREWSPST